MDSPAPETRKPRARDLGLPFDGTPGPWNAITDVPGIAVGQHRLIEAQPRPGRKVAVRTGVTAIIPHADAAVPTAVFAGLHRFNGNGEMTGTHWIEDGGHFLGPVVLTNTHSLGIAHHATIRWMIDRFPGTYQQGRPHWVMPVVSETWDGILNDINAQALAEGDVLAALAAARPGPVAEGNSGGGTGMIAYGFKAGTGTASRRLAVAGGEYTIGTLVQANHGQRDWLTIRGVPVGQELAAMGHGAEMPERGSIVVIIATDIPMAPHQLRRLARRATIGIGRGGTPGGNNSGDIFLAFSTANPRPLTEGAPEIRNLAMIDNEAFDPIYLATVEAVEEAVINAMVAAEGMDGAADGRGRVEALPIPDLLEVMARYGRVTV